MKKLISISLLLANLLIADSWSYRDGDTYRENGYIRNGSGDFSSFNQRIYEWEHVEGVYYCFHAAGATAINMRQGEKITDEVTVLNYFENNLNGYDNINDTSANDWLNASNRFHLTDLQITQKPDRGYFKTKEAFWQEVKNLVENNQPALFPVAQYKADVPYDDGYNVAEGFSGDIGHALLIVAFFEHPTLGKLIAVRDPAISNSYIKSNYPYYELFDYTIKLDWIWKNRETFLQKNAWGDIKFQLLSFNTKKDGNLEGILLKNETDDLVYTKNLSVEHDRFYYKTIRIEKDGELTVKINNLTNDADLYIRKNSKPVTNNYDDMSFNGGTMSETIVRNVKKYEIYYIGVHGWDEGTTKFDLKATLK